MEGGIDSSHVSFLHRGDLNSDPLHKNTAGAKYTRSTNTVFDILELPGGLLIGARRNADPGYHYWRVTQWLMPWYTLIPPYKGHAAQRPRLGADGRSQLHGLDHDVPSGARPVRPKKSN